MAQPRVRPQTNPVSTVRVIAGQVCRVVAVMSVAASCSTGATKPQTGPAPAAWERATGESLENRGIARVERIGARWALTVHCSGTHTTYLDATSLDLERYARGFVHARYKYVDRTIPDPKCVLAPCANVTERLIALEQLTAVNATAEDAARSARECQPAISPLDE